MAAHARIRLYFLILILFVGYIQEETPTTRLLNMDDHRGSKLTKGRCLPLTLGHPVKTVFSAGIYSCNRYRKDRLRDQPLVPLP